MTRRHLLWSIAGVSIVLVAIGVGVLAHQVRRDRICEDVLERIDRLALVPPKGTTELEWAAIVYWTHNLHCNSIPQLYGDLDTLQELDAFIENESKSGPSMSTIDGLWDRYARISDCGSQYRLKYEPLRKEISAAIAVEGDNYADASSYRGFLTSIRSSQSGSHSAK